ncbi:Fe-S protein assembly co-chaperone HscB [Rickettsiales endosymbiont of Stachyamoeba lipophora]|uniref:Fe-S protein assembly co-chaperone HscB n=1 Tax=Rickettsiales endosymbiont of Stachyamoeba lipophora TaxID=2486578 RepID=UPI000F64C2ED|nr:Fe-S protein assembly co-chaperone HscB [Rickettsiales endosymbiont of Stachyamoeba lipophora]AZL15217.1 Fe-S protein assembly co-chaperone HscB [Rickettsiales endosymbiont of Stachyamoeba lipophora]
MQYNNYFEIFGLNPEFNVDTDNLHNEYLKLQERYHPDKNSDLNSASFILDINKAYKILKDEVSRALYLLTMHNIFISDEASRIKPSQLLVLEILEIKETIYSLGSLSELKLEEQIIKNNLADFIKQFSTFYTQYDLFNATEVALKMQYYKKILEDIKICKQKLLD